MTRLCVIFDLDGTLVDSEGLCNQAFLDLLPEINDSVETLVQRYRGRKLEVILADLAARLGRALPSDFEQRYRQRVSERFAHELKPTPGAHDMLKSMTYPRCIASSGPLKKIRQALAVSGLAPYFGDHIFSSYEIKSWKPDPGLFLHAAEQMGFAPADCVVIEDSKVGIEAATTAGMRALQYVPNDGQDIELANGMFRHMSELPELLVHFASAHGRSD